MQPAPINYDQDFPPLESQPNQTQNNGNEYFSQYQLWVMEKNIAATAKRKEENDKINQEFPDIELISYKDPYKSLAGKLCGVQIWKRVLREVTDVNKDFHSLRACIGIVGDTIGVLHFLLYPNDGAIADKPLCGRILIPTDYPKTTSCTYVDSNKQMQRRCLSELWPNSQSERDALQYVF